MTNDQLTGPTHALLQHLKLPRTQVPITLNYQATITCMTLQPAVTERSNHQKPFIQTLTTGN